METKSAYRQKVEAQLKQIDAEITKLKAKGAEAEADAKIEYQRQIKGLEMKQATVKRRFNEFSSASETAWQDIRTGLESALGELKQSLEKASSHFTN